MISPQVPINSAPFSLGRRAGDEASMQEMKKQAIVIASILKPVDDTRMFEKMGRSLAATGQWQVHIIGFGVSAPLGETEMTFHSLGMFSRISLRRLLAPIKVLRKLIQVKPNAVIVNTHELLCVASVYKIFSGASIFYDIRENYSWNIRSTNAFPMGIRLLVSLYVRLVEWMTSPFIKHYFLAEKNYEAELPFIGKKFSVIENKCKLPDSYKRSPTLQGIQLLFTGTLHESTGVFEAMELVKKLNRSNPQVSLKIIGHCAVQITRRKIAEAVAGQSFITVVGLDQLVPHDQIFKEISEATAGIIYYHDSPHVKDRIPTKLYEYLTCRLPILYDEKAVWSSLVSDSTAGIAIDLHNPNTDQIIQTLLGGKFYTRDPIGTSWESEEQRFLEKLNT